MAVSRRDGRPLSTRSGSWS